MSQDVDEPGSGATLEQLAAAFTELAPHLAVHDPVPILQLATRHVPGCSWASITTIEHRDGTTLASSAPEAVAADTVQHRLRRGPCMMAARERAYHTVFSLGAPERWPAVAHAIRLETPVRAVLAVHMLDNNPTSLNLYSDRPDGFDADSAAAAAVIAGQTAAVLSSGRPAAALTELRDALDSRRDVSTALDILTTDTGMDRSDALLALYAASRRLHRSLRSVSEQVARTRTLPAG